MKSLVKSLCITDVCRPPHGGRGLKCIVCDEIDKAFGRPPHGGRGLKYNGVNTATIGCSRPPHGGRGLKFNHLAGKQRPARVALLTEGVD